MPQYVKLRDDLIAAAVEIDGARVYNIKDPATGSYFQLREPEYWLIRQFDGATDYESIADRFREKFQLNIDAAQVEAFASSLEKMYFLESSRAEQAVSRTAYLPEMGDSLFARLLFVKLKGFRPGRLLDFLTRLYRPFHNPFWLVVSIGIVLFGVGVILSNADTFTVNFTEIFNLGSIAMVMTAIFLVVALHEFAHAISCRYYGGDVAEIGFLLLFFQPCFYSDVSDAWLFEKKSQRLAVTWAGPFFQFFILAVAAIVWRITVPGQPVNELARIVAIVGWVTIMFNFNPLIKLDGYYLLSDWLDIPNLRQKAFRYLGNVLKRRLLGWPIDVYEVTSRERRIFLTYSLLALVYSVILIGYMLTVFGRFLLAKTGPVGLLLLVVLLALSLRSTLTGLARGTVKHLRYMKSLLKKPVRLATYLILLALVIVIGFVLPFTHRVSGEVRVRPIAVFSIGLNDFGLLESTYRMGGAEPQNKSGYLQMTSTDMAKLELVPLCRDGEEVIPGDTLAVISSNQVSSEIAGAQAEQARLESELALLKSPPKPEALAQAEAEVAAAQTTYDQAVRDLDRARMLAEKNLSSSEELESAQTAVDVAAAELNNRKSSLELLKSPPKPEEEAVLMSQLQNQRSKLDFLISQQDAQSITTPIGGTVTMQPDQAVLMSVVAYDSVEVRIPIADFDINLVRPDQPVAIKVRSFPGRTFEGTVVHVPKVAVDTRGSAAFMVTAVVDNDHGLLLEGMTGYAKIAVGDANLATLLLRKVASNIRVEFWSWW